jgi:hypothetical protein
MWAEANSLMSKMAHYFSPQELTYLSQQVDAVVFKDEPSWPAGFFSPGSRAIGINTLPDLFSSGLSPLPESCQMAHTLAHEMRHPLLLLAAQDSRTGYLIINPDIRRNAQEKAKAFAPEAIKAAESVLESPHVRPFPDWNKFTPDERIAADLYLIMDNRYYDLFGSSLKAKLTGRGYTMPDRDHEVGCNLKGLQAVEEIVTGKPAVLLKELAGDILEMLDQKVNASLNKNPDRAPVKVKAGGGQASTM